MSYSRPPVAAALTEAFQTAAPWVNVFDRPPATINAPALVVVDPTTRQFSNAGMGVDQTELIVTAVVGLEQVDDLDDLMNLAASAIKADPTLGRLVMTATVTEGRNWRALTVGGANFRAADLAVRIDM